MEDKEKPILVSIISEQTIPNLLIIKHFFNEVKGNIFLTTQQMETQNLATSRSNWISNAGTLHFNQIQKIILKEDNYVFNIQQLKAIINGNEKYILNITGGTKIMTLSAYDFFKNLPNCRIIYLPIQQNTIHQIFPEVENTSISVQLTVDEYLKAYGLNFIANRPVYDAELVNLIMKKARGYHFDINRLNADYENEHRNYFTGGWFEEFVYYKLIDDLKLKEDEIKLNVKINYHYKAEEHNIDNEFDVIFVYQNSIYLIECKTSLGRNTYQNLLDAITKLGSVKQNFGLNCKSYLLTLSEINNLAEMNRKASIAGLKKIIDREFFKSNKDFKSILA